MCNTQEKINNSNIKTVLNINDIEVITKTLKKNLNNNITLDDSDIVLTKDMIKQISEIIENKTKKEEKYESFEDFEKGSISDLTGYYIYEDYQGCMETIEKILMSIHSIKMFTFHKNLEKDFNEFNNKFLFYQEAYVYATKKNIENHKTSDNIPYSFS